MDINLLPSVPIPPGSFSSNELQNSAEARVHKEITPIPAVAATETEAHESGTGTERKVLWVPEEKRPVYRVIDSKSGGVICQIPSEEVLRIVHRFEEILLENDEARNEVAELLKDGSEINVRS